MKILIIVHYWPPHIGGIETVAYEQAIRLSNMGHDITVITSRTGRVCNGCPNPNLRVFRFPIWNFLEKLGIPYPILNPLHFFKYLAFVKSNEVVFIHNHSFMNSFFACAAAKICGRPIVLLQHTPKIKYRFPWNLAQKMADVLFGKFVIQASDKVLAVSEYTASYVQKLSKNKNPIILWNGIDTLRFRPIKPSVKRKYKKSRSIDSQAVVFLTVRRLVDRTGVDVLIKAFSKIQLNRNVFLVIVGSGSQINKLKSLARSKGIKNILFTGRVNETDLLMYYQMSDVFVLPSLSGEGFGLSLLEAMSSGLPCIVSSDGGHRGFFQDGKEGVTFETGDHDDLAESMIHLLNNIAVRKSMGEFGVETAGQFSWDQNADHLQRVLLGECSVS
tara:strand:- start:2502 stop:3662 length:1161 start_codon:yes stop_codon:yes gene_type:complete